MKIGFELLKEYERAVVDFNHGLEDFVPGVNPNNAFQTLLEDRITNGRGYIDIPPSQKALAAENDSFTISMHGGRMRDNILSNEYYIAGKNSAAGLQSTLAMMALSSASLKISEGVWISRHGLDYEKNQQVMTELRDSWLDSLEKTWLPVYDQIEKDRIKPPMEHVWEFVEKEGPAIYREVQRKKLVSLIRSTFGLKN